MAAPVFRASTTQGQANGTSLAVNKPTGTVDGDALLVFIYLESTSVTITPPAGWTEVTACGGNNSSASNVYQHRIYRKVASSEGASWNWTWGGSSLWRNGVCVAYDTSPVWGSSADPTDTGGSAKTFNTDTVSESTWSGAAGITTSAATEMALQFVSNSNSGSSDTYTGSNGQTTRVNYGETAVMEKSISSAGATGNMSFSKTGAADKMSSSVLALVTPSSVSVLAPPLIRSGYSIRNFDPYN